MIRRLLMFGEGVLGTLSSTALTAGVSTRGIGFTWTGAAKKGGGGLGRGCPRNTPGFSHRGGCRMIGCCTGDKSVCGGQRAGRGEGVLAAWGL